MFLTGRSLLRVDITHDLIRLVLFLVEGSAYFAPGWLWARHVQYIKKKKIQLVSRWEGMGGARAPSQRVKPLCVFCLQAWSSEASRVGSPVLRETIKQETSKE